MLSQRIKWATLGALHSRAKEFFNFLVERFKNQMEQLSLTEFVLKLFGDGLFRDEVLFRAIYRTRDNLIVLRQWGIWSRY